MWNEITECWPTIFSQESYTSEQEASCHQTDSAQCPPQSSTQWRQGHPDRDSIKYWIIGGRSLVRMLINGCVICRRIELHLFTLFVWTKHHRLPTVNLTSQGTPVGVAAGNLWLGNLWLVRLATFTLQPMEHTNHKFPAATATDVPCEVKSTVHCCGFCWSCVSQKEGIRKQQSLDMPVHVLCYSCYTSWDGIGYVNTDFP